MRSKRKEFLAHYVRAYEKFKGAFAIPKEDLVFVPPDDLELIRNDHQLKKIEKARTEYLKTLISIEPSCAKDSDLIKRVGSKVVLLNGFIAGYRGL